MPGKGHAYQITEEWQDLVRRAMEDKGIGHNELARLAKMSGSSLTGVLKKGAIQTTKMPAINKALGMAPPLDSPAPIVQEGAGYLAQLDEIEQGRWVERLRHAVEEKKRTRR